VIALFSGPQMVSVGILGKCVGRMHFRGMQRPTYLVLMAGRDDGPRAGLFFAHSPANVHGDPDSVAAELRHRQKSYSAFVATTITEEPNGRFTRPSRAWSMRDNPISTRSTAGDNCGRVGSAGSPRE
jgi:hypothetical protein